MSDHTQLIAANNQRWDGVVIKDHWLQVARGVAKRLSAPKAKATYQALEHATGVPWYVVAMIHEREAGQSWNANIAQGDPFNRRSVHKPAGRGPFNSFFEAAVDALMKCPPFAAQWKDWSVGGLLTLLELYNGEGYELYHHMASPYLWSGTNRYTKGKYVSDGHFDPEAVDEQLGCAVLYQAMIELDPSIAVGPGDPVPEADMTANPPIVDPTLYPPPQDKPKSPDKVPEVGAAQAPPGWLATQLKRKAEDTFQGTDVSVVKSLWKSHIGWGTLGLGGTAVANAAAQAPASAFTRALEVLHHPTFWLLGINIGLTVYVLYHYWRDHGKGSV